MYPPKRRLVRRMEDVSVSRADALSAFVSAFATLYFGAHVLRAFLVNGWPFN